MARPVVERKCGLCVMIHQGGNGSHKHRLKLLVLNYKTSNKAVCLTGGRLKSGLTATISMGDIFVNGFLLYWL